MATLQWLSDVVHYLYKLEAYTTGGGVNALLACGLLVVLVAGGTARVLFGLLDRATYALERRTVAKRAEAEHREFEAKPFPATDLRVKLGLVWIAFTLACLGTLALIQGP
jgi:hypothetical protein